MPVLNLDIDVLVTTLQRSRPAAKDWRTQKSFKHTLPYNQWYDMVYDIARILNKQDPSFTSHDFITRCQTLPSTRIDRQERNRHGTQSSVHRPGLH